KRSVDSENEQQKNTTVQTGKDHNRSEQQGFEVEDHMRDDDAHKCNDAAETDCHERRDGGRRKEQDAQPCSIHTEAERPFVSEIEKIELPAVFVDDDSGYGCKDAGYQANFVCCPGHGAEHILGDGLRLIRLDEYKDI